MSKFAHSDVLDGGPLVVKNGAVRMVLLKAYAFGDTYATMQANKVSEVVMTAADFTIASSGNNRTLTVAAKSVAAAAAAAAGTSGGAVDHHIALHDNVSRVLLVTDETGEAAVAVNDTNNFPTWVYTAQQPT